MKNIYLIISIAAMLLVTSCASTSPSEVKVPLADDAFSLYQKSRMALKAENYQTAIRQLEQLDSLYPFGEYSHFAQLNLIYAYYKVRDNASAIAAADRFIRQNPSHQDVDYAYFMKGRINFEAEVGFFKELLSADLSERDASTARQAFTDFAELVRKFPASKYAKEARERMIFLRNRLARYELHVAKFYMERQSYIAAANRARYVVEHYPQTDVVPDALVIMITAYDILDLPELSEKNRKVLQLNFPEKAKQVL